MQAYNINRGVMVRAIEICHPRYIYSIILFIRRKESSFLFYREDCKSLDIVIY